MRHCGRHLVNSCPGDLVAFRDLSNRDGGVRRQPVDRSPNLAYAGIPELVGARMLIPLENQAKVDGSVQA